MFSNALRLNPHETSTTLSVQKVVSGCSSQEVRAQLGVILSHELFSRSPVLSGFLKYIVEETLTGNAILLKEYTIGVNALRRKSDFNPQMDAVVRIHAGRLRRLIAEYYTEAGTQDEIIIGVVKGSYIPVFSRSVREKKPPCLFSPSKSEANRVSISKIVVAILPFRDLCEFRDKQFFVDGLGEEFTRVFCNSQEFAVVGHHSTFKLSVQKASLRSIGLKLSAEYIISGVVMQDQKRLRINVGLSETDTSTQIWSKVFEYERGSDLLDMQRQLTGDVYSLLGGQFGFIVSHRARTIRSGSGDFIEFNPVLFNYQLQTRFSINSYATTRHALQLAVQLEPQFSPALALLTELNLWGLVLGYPVEDALPATTMQLAQKAMNHDPLSRHAKFSYLWAMLYKKGVADILPEIEWLLNQDPPLHLEAAKLGSLLVWGGDYERGKDLIEQAIKRNHHYPWSFHLALSLVYFNDNRYSDALDSIDKIEAMDVYLVDLMKAVLLTKLGMPQQAEYFHRSLMENYASIALSLEQNLRNFLLDEILISKIIKGAQEAGDTKSS
ncbi:MAG TPA: hypothetical protein VIU12_08755 [Chryseolinea sp.]